MMDDMCNAYGVVGGFCHEVLGDRRCVKSFTERAMNEIRSL